MFPDLFRDDVFRLETQRLWLRWPMARDAAAIERLAGERAVAEMTACIPHPYSREAASAFIYTTRVGNAQGAALSFMLAPLARPSDAIGAICLREEDRGMTLGFWLGRPFWGRGLMSEAVEALTASVLAMTDHDAILSSVRVDDAVSRRVLEKCGFTTTGTRRIHLAAREAAFECAFYARSRNRDADRRQARVAMG